MMETKSRYSAEPMYYDAVDAMADDDLPLAIDQFRSVCRKSVLSARNAYAAQKKSDHFS